MFGANLAQWLILASLAVAILTIAGKLGAFGERVRTFWRQRRSSVDSGDWRTPEEARTRLTERALVEEWIAARQEYADARMASDRALAELHSISAQTSREDANRRSENFQTIDKICGAAGQRLQISDDAVREDLMQKLRCGELIGKGFVAPHEHGAKAKLIPTREWEFLRLLEQAEVAEGGGITYFQVRIRQT